MNPTPAQIVESRAWANMLERLNRAYFESFIAVQPADNDALRRLRDKIDVLRDVDRELQDMARATT